MICEDADLMKDVERCITKLYWEEDIETRHLLWRGILTVAKKAVVLTDTHQHTIEDFLE